MIRPRDIIDGKSIDAVLIESKFDDAIRKAAEHSSWPARVDIRGWNRRQIDVVVEIYQHAGWRVSVVTDHRDGDFVEILRQ